MAVAQHDSFLPSKEFGVEREVKENGRPPPFHIASLLSTSPRPEKRDNSCGGSVHHKPVPGPSGSGDVLGASVDYSYPCQCGDAGPSCSCVFYQGASFLTSLTLQHPPIPANPIYYPPSTYHVHYQLPNELTPTPPVPPTAGELENDLPSIPVAVSQRNTRTTYTADQLQTLERVFSEKKYVTFEDRLRISREVGVTEKQIKMWFQNRRTKMRKQLQSRHSSNKRTRSISKM